MKVAIYCRLSKEDEDKLQLGDDSESIQNQKLLLVDYAKQNNWEIARIFTDENYSGMDRNRPAFLEMIKGAKEREFDIILCKNQSRFSRDMEMIEKYLHHLFLLWGIRFVGLVDHVDTQQRNGKKSRQINGLVNEWYCEDVSENVRAALAAKKKCGQYLGHWCVYGYKLSREDKHKIVPDEEAASVVKEIFALFTKGKSVRDIAGHLTEKGYMPPSLYKRQQGINYFNPNLKKDGWSVNTIRKILQDETYLGHLVQGKERKVNYKTNKILPVPKDEWIVVRNNHEGIINQVTYRLAQDLLKKKTNARSGRPVMIGFGISGKIHCLGCGNPMGFKSGRNGVRYLKCKLAAGSAYEMCGTRAIRLDMVTSLIEQTLKPYMDSYKEDTPKRQKIWLIFKKKWQEKSRLKKDMEKRQLLEQKIHNLTASLKQAFLDKNAGLLSAANFYLLQHSLDEERRELERDLNELRYRLDHSAEGLSEAEFYQMLDQWLYKDEKLQKLAGDWIEKIEIGNSFNEDKKYITLYWHIPTGV